MQHLIPNSTLQSGKYKIVRFLSSGGFGNTYEGVHTMMDTRVAIKEFFPKMFCNRDENTSHVTVATQGNRELVEKLRKKFNEEAKAVFQMNHPNIVRVLDIFEENSTAYYVMEYIDGKSLNDITQERGALPEVEAVGYIRQVADALKYVHSLNRLHLDIKPGNIMVDKNGKAILIDFGASKHYDMESGENTSTLMGVNTKGYAPIEQSTQSFTTFSPATDIYALGATLYKLLTGVTPPDANLLIAKEEKLQDLPFSISSSTRNAVFSAMILIRSERPQNIDNFINLFNVDRSHLNIEENLTEVNEVTIIDIEKTRADSIFSSKRLVPVSTWNVWGKKRNLSTFVFCTISITCVVSVLLFLAYIPLLMEFGFYGWVSYGESSYKEPLSGTYLLSAIIVLVADLSFFFLFQGYFFPNHVIKRSKEIAQTDYIEEYDKRSKKYAIVARGQGNHTRYGLFNVKTLRLVTPIKYDNMKWINNKLLEVKVENQTFSLDTNGHEFK